MINPITPQNTTRTSIFYLNDVHGQTLKMERLYNASRDFDSFEHAEPVDKLKFSSGDTMLGESEKVNTVAAKFLNMCNIMATAVGNHEFDTSLDNLDRVSKEANYKMLGANAQINHPIQNKILKSYIQEANGTKYGIIGLMPVDFMSRTKFNEVREKIKLDDIDETINTVQEEVNRLKSEGVNKIIVLSHIGNVNEKRLAQETSGIDVILGGHSHELIKDVKAGENLLYSKTGEPVVITQAGKDGDYFGILNLEFDSTGIIKKVQNNVTNSLNYDRNEVAKYIFEQQLGKPEAVGTIKYADPEPLYRLIESNPHANFIADAVNKELGTDITLINSANIRGHFEVGQINSREISAITPFKNKMTIVPISEKDLVDALNVGAKSFDSKGNKPGLFAASGIEYTVSRKGKLLELTYIDKSGQRQVIDINNPNPQRIFRVAMDDFCAMGNDGMVSLNKIDKAEKVFDFDKDKLVCDYLKKQKEPVEIRLDDRLKIVD